MFADSSATSGNTRTLIQKSWESEIVFRKQEIIDKIIKSTCLKGVNLSGVGVLTAFAGITVEIIVEYIKGYLESSTKRIAGWVSL